MYTNGSVRALRCVSLFAGGGIGVLLLACLTVAGCTGDPADTALLPAQQTNPDRDPPAAAVRVNVFNDSAYVARVQVDHYIGNTLVHHCEAALEPAASSDLGDRLLLDWEEADRVVITCRIDGPDGTSLWSEQKTHRLGIDFADLDTVAYAIVYGSVGDLPPVADVQAPAAMTSGRAVTLDGSYSHDPAGGALSYSWQQIAGPTVTLSDPAAAAPTFTAPDVTSPTDLVFRLTVSNGTQSASKDVTVTIRPNRAPVAVATATEEALADTTVTLDGAGSYDPDGDPITYAWVQVSGTPVTLSGTSTPVVTFTAPTPIEMHGFSAFAQAGVAASEELRFQLTVADQSLSSHVEVSVLVYTPSPNEPPVASIAPVLPAIAGEIVVLDGSCSYDVDEDPLTYHWTQLNSPPDPAVTLEPSVYPWEIQFTVPSCIVEPQTLTFQLIVNDGHADSEPDTVVVDVSPALTMMSKPFALPPVVLGGMTVSLDGSASKGNITSWRWTQLSGPAVTLSPDADQAQVSFVAPAASSTPETLVFELMVSDGTNSHSASVSVTVTDMESGTGVAVPLGPSSAMAGETVSLYGSASFDTVGEPLTYEWIQVSGPDVVLSDMYQADVTFTVPDVLAMETLEFQLTVLDSTMGPTFHSLTMNVYPASYDGNRCPVLTLSASSATASPGQMVTITATATDPDGDPVDIYLMPMFGPVSGVSGPSPLVHSFQMPAGPIWPDNLLRFMVVAEDGNGEVTVVPVLVTVGVTGDVDGDGFVTIMDLMIVDEAMGSTPGAANWDPRADLDGDGVVTLLDRLIVLNHMV